MPLTGMTKSTTGSSKSNLPDVGHLISAKLGTNIRWYEKERGDIYGLKKKKTTMESILGKYVGSQYITYSNASCMTVHVMEMQNPLEVRALWNHG